MAASSEAGVLERPAIKEKKAKSASAPKRKAREGSRKRRPADPNAQGRRNQALGARGEEAAARVLQRNGYTILERNWTCFAGEADIIAVNVMQPHLAPFVMPVQRLVYHAMGQDVDLVIVDGQIAMEGRTLTQISEEKVLEDAARAFEKMISRLNRPEVMQNDKLYELRQ